jgi:hypothetical protein
LLLIFWRRWSLLLVVFYDSFPLLEIILYIYTALMVLARSFTLFSPSFRAITTKKVSDAPVWIYHLLYLLNTLLLGTDGYFILASGWLFIWGVAAYVHHLQTRQSRV